MNTTMIPPPYVDMFEYKACVQINDPIKKRRVYLTPDGEKLPSVTTILSTTKDKTHLNEWRAKVGAAKADRIVSEAAGVGTAMHNNLERYLVGEPRQPGRNPVHVKANAMADVIIQNAMPHLDAVVAMEQQLYYPGLYSGTTDLVAIYDGNLAICDYKQSNKPKKIEWVEDYMLQLVSYAMAHNEVYGTDIREGHIFMCTRGDDPLLPGGEVYQQFDLWPKDFEYYENLWLAKLSDFYTNYWDT